MNRILATCLLLLLCGTALSGQRNLKRYYFKLNQYDDPSGYNVLPYICSESPEHTQYVYLWSNGDTLFTRVFDAKGNRSANAVEVYEKDHARLIALTLYYPDGQDEIMEERVHLEQPAVVFEWRPDGPFMYKFRSEDLDQVLHRRRMRSGTVKLRMGGKKRKMVRFTDQLSFSTDFSDSPVNTYFYARRAGLVRMDLNYGDGEIRILEVGAPLTPAQFLERFPQAEMP